jgi:hypothetical protein
MTMAVVRAVEIEAPLIISQVKVPLKRASSMAPKAPKAAASVGVATPARMVPMTARIRPKGGTRLLRIMKHLLAEGGGALLPGDRWAILGAMAQRMAT